MAVRIFGPYRLDSTERRLTRGDDVVRLSPKAFDLLCFFVERQGRLVSRADILAEVWKGTAVDDATLAVHVMALRKALPLDNEALLETVPRAGYRFLPAVVDEPSPSVAEPVSVATLPPVEHAAPAMGRRSWRMAAAALVVAVAALAAWRLLTPSADRDAVRSLAVMPFVSLGPEQDAAYLETGMADAIITRLAQLGHLRVPSTATVRYFATKKIAPLDAARQMGVDAVLTGTLQRDEDRIRITVQVTRVADGTPVWSERFDERFTGIFSLQDAITELIASRLRLDIGPGALTRVRRRMPVNTQAYEAYLRGRELWAQRNAPNIRTAIALYEQAIEADPNFALAYSGLADAYAVSVSGMPALERMPKAKAAAERALALDPTLPDAHNSLGFIQYKFEWKWTESAASFRKAIELDPGFELAHHWYGESLSLQGQHDEALRLLRRARDLNKFNFGVRLDLANSLNRARRYDEALLVSEEGMALDPTVAGLYNSASVALRGLNKPADALEYMVRGRLVSNAPAAEITRIRETFARDGFAGLRRFDIALAEGAEKARQGASRAPVLSALYAEERNLEAALTWIGVSFERRDDGPLYLRAPSFDFMRNDPRFKAFEARVAMP